MNHPTLLVCVQVRLEGHHWQPWGAEFNKVGWRKTVHNSHCWAPWPHGHTFTQSRMKSFLSVQDVLLLGFWDHTWYQYTTKHSHTNTFNITYVFPFTAGFLMTFFFNDTYLKTSDSQLGQTVYIWSQNFMLSNFQRLSIPLGGRKKEWMNQTKLGSFSFFSKYSETKVAIFLMIKKYSKSYLFGLGKQHSLWV